MKESDVNRELSRYRFLPFPCFAASTVSVKADQEQCGGPTDSTSTPFASDGMSTKKKPKAENKNRCWPGYEPVPGKPVHSQGSCRKKPDTALKPAEKEFRAKRERQLADWKKKHPKSPKKAAQHLRKPAA